MGARAMTFLLRCKEVVILKQPIFHVIKESSLIFIYSVH